MENPLALSVINDSASYNERVTKYRTMKQGQYRGYIQALVAKIAHREHVQFGTRHKPAAIEAATVEVVQAMHDHMTEWDAAQLAEHDKVHLGHAYTEQGRTPVGTMSVNNGSSVVITMPSVRRGY